MSDLFRDTAFGQIVRWVTKNKVFQYPEERDPEIWTRYLDAQKSANAAKFGQTEKPEEGEDAKVGQDVDKDEAQNALPEAGQRTPNSRSSSRTQVGDDVNAVSGTKVDQEKGKDLHVIGWYGDDDPGMLLRLLLDNR